MFEDTKAKFLGIDESKEPKEIQKNAESGENVKITDNQLYADILNRRKNIILEGPPGTGKTHAIKGIVEQLEKSKEDGVEGLKIGGRGKGKWAITMHPATSYEDFIEGLRPVDASDEEDDEKSDAKSSFIYKPGVFVERVRDAIQNPHQQHVVLLDELNRSNVPRVLGDLLTTLEASKRTKPLFQYPTELLSDKHESGNQEVKILLVSLPKKATLEEMKEKLLEDIDNPNDRQKNRIADLKGQIRSVRGPTTKKKLAQLKQELKQIIDTLKLAKLKILLSERMPDFPTGNSTCFRPIKEALVECDTDMESFEIWLKGDDGENIKMNRRDLAKTSCERFIFDDENNGNKSHNVLFVMNRNYAFPVINKELQKACVDKDQDSLERQNTVEILTDDGIITCDINIVEGFSEPGENNTVFTANIQYAAESNHTCPKVDDYYWCNSCDKRWDKKRTEVTLSGSKKKLHIPDNLLVVGTMNTTDRSVAPLDSALRRRFVFLRVDPQTTIFKESETKFQSLSDDAKKYFEDAKKNWISLNTWLETNLGKDATIGHSYLFELIEQLSKTKDSTGDPKEYTKQMWQYSILPQVADLLDATGQSHALWGKNPKPAKEVKEYLLEKVKKYLLGLKLELKTPDENMNRTFSRTLVVQKPKKERNKNKDEEE
jgi:MoxR-like ATPase